MSMIFRGPGLLLLCVFTSTAVFGRDLDHDEALELARSGQIQPLDRLLQQALGTYPGATLLEAELELEHGRYRYEVELLTASGTVRELAWDAQSGQLLKDEEDD